MLADVVDDGDDDDDDDDGDDDDELLLIKLNNRWPTKSLDHCQRFSPSQISDTPRAGFKSAQKLSSGFVEWSYTILTTSPHHGTTILISLYKSKMIS